jgi:8-oxo-dGTP diphosphatase
MRGYLDCNSSLNSVVNFKEKRLGGLKMHMMFGKKENETYFDRKGAYLIALKEDKIAVIRTPKGYFLFGGGINEDEQDEECIHRECLEEIGYSVEIDQFIGSAETYCEHPKIGYFYPIQNYYFGELKEAIKEPIEIDHVLEWVPYEKIKNNMFLKMQNWAIDECWKKIR